MLDKTSSIICAFGLAAAAPRSPYRHLELCGIALTKSLRRNSVYARFLHRLISLTFFICHLPGFPAGFFLLLPTLHFHLS
ncbi:hypothetical protein [Gemmiger qucibialis]|uniref:hypothetical protein n=1 Tax=Gemmiger qucibialis TaxID=2997294 RepID=UPI0022E4185C|nr:hypothetical protein [Gemmiger qucibialis]